MDLMQSTCVKIWRF